jgi:hypothetical protein
LRDDIKQATATCEVPSINLLYLSGKIGRQEETEPGSGQFVGWADAGCAADDLNCVQAEPAVGAGLTCDSSFCFGTDPEIFEGDTVGVRLSDTVFNSYTSQGGATVYYTRPSGFENTGYYMQDVGVVNAGEYILSWYDRVPVGSSAVDYMVSLSGTQDATVIQTPTGSWGSRQLHVHVSQPTEMQVQIHPSWTDTQEYGDVWLWGMQLERIGPERCADYGSCSQVPPRPYEETDEDRMTERQDCPDYDGAIMRAEDFRRECVCPSSEGFNSQCDDDDLTSSYRICYWTTTINLTAEGIERGEMIPSNNVAIGNFNYRQDEVAVNLVGTNVKSCEGSSAICNSNAFIPYTLVHQGTVPVRNYHRKTYEFSMPVARVEHGKALAAEVLVTNPPTSTHNQLLGPYFKTGLRGRPLHGTYELRIWETAELNWEAVEDVQLVFKYRYWTRMTY